jgi:hypothetical protein
MFKMVVDDFRKLLPVFASHGIILAGPMGTGAPEVTDSVIAFNGASNCGHPKRDDVSIPWPAQDAGGIGQGDSEYNAGSWFAGTVLRTRVCNGDCSYETFRISSVFNIDGYWPLNQGWALDFTKTAFRPYDVAVCAALIVAKHHLQDRILVRSDGEERHWFDAKLVCHQTLGYGMRPAIDAQAEPPVHSPSVAKTTDWVTKTNVKSESEDRDWVVSVDRSGGWACSCPRWKFHRVICKHILNVFGARNSESRVL